MSNAFKTNKIIVFHFSIGHVEPAITSPTKPEPDSRSVAAWPHRHPSIPQLLQVSQVSGFQALEFGEVRMLSPSIIYAYGGL